jgi:hypothetical protein
MSTTRLTMQELLSHPRICLVAAAKSLMHVVLAGCSASLLFCARYFAWLYPLMSYSAAFGEENLKVMLTQAVSSDCSSKGGKRGLLHGLLAVLFQQAPKSSFLPKCVGRGEAEQCYRGVDSRLGANQDMQDKVARDRCAENVFLCGWKQAPYFNGSMVALNTHIYEAMV